MRAGFRFFVFGRQIADGRRQTADRRIGLRVQSAECRGQRSEVRGQSAECRVQRTEVRSQRSEVRGQGMVLSERIFKSSNAQIPKYSHPSCQKPAVRRPRSAVKSANLAYFLSVKFVYLHSAKQQSPQNRGCTWFRRDGVGRRLHAGFLFDTRKRTENLKL